MSTLKNFRISVVLFLLLLVPVFASAQTDKKAAETKKLETSLTAAKLKVSMNEKQLAKSDSLITLGNQMITDAKAENKSIEADRKKLDKENAVNQKPLLKLTTSKDKEEALKARSDLKALDLQYKSDSKALGIRLRDATKKMSTGNANLTRGKTGKKTAQDALKLSKKTLEAAQSKYDDATAVAEDAPSKGKKKK